MPDWSQIQSFAAVAEHGSLSAAAIALGSSQPTLSRHISQLEESVGTRLFERGVGGMVLTQSGADLLEHANTMADAAGRFAIIAEGQRPDLAGTVRITASRVMAAFVLPDILREMHETYPEIQVEMVATDTTENLLRRESDIALRMYRPTQNDVISRHVTDIPLAVYAAHDYVAKHGAPATVDDLKNHSVIGYDRSPLIIDGLRAAGLPVTRDFFAFRSDDQIVCWHLVVAGCGVGFCPRAVGDAEPRVVRVSGDVPTAVLPIWLTAHPDLRSVPRVRRVYDWLAKRLGSINAHT